MNHPSLARTSEQRPSRASVLAPLALALGIMLALAFPSIASAHAKLHSSNPAPGSVLTKAPTTITLTFEEHVVPATSSVIVYDATGKVVSTPATVDSHNAEIMHVNMTGNGSDNYLIVWKTVSLDDGAPDIGAFNIYVGSDAVPTATTPSNTSSGVAGGLAALIGILGLVIGGAGGFFFARRAK
jgi:copper transport protein